MDYAETSRPGSEAVCDGSAEGAAFARVYEEHFAFVWSTARRLGVPDAALDDAVQEVFVIVHRRLGEFENRSSMKTWLFAIVRNVARQVRRTIVRKSPHDAPGALADPEALAAAADQRPDRAVERSAESRVLYDMLDRLDDDKREVFVLAELEELTVPVIAAAIGVNVSTVYSRLRLAREEFAEAAARYRARERGMQK